jgi:tetratricopeptide (TPR) repeat protein
VPPDHQQALLLEVLRGARGGPVSYQELRDAGIEYPAAVVAELELAGLPLERCFEGSMDARRLLGVRLYVRDDAPHDPPGGGREERSPTPPSNTLTSDSLTQAIAGIAIAPAARALRERAQQVLAWLADQATLATRAARRALSALSAARRALCERARGALEEARVNAQPAGRSSSDARPGARASRAPQPRGGGASARWLAPAALIVAAAIVAAVAVGGLAGAGPAPRASSHPRPQLGTSTSTSATRATRAPSAPQPPVPVTPPAQVSPTQVSPALAAQLETRGHALLLAGEPESAVPVLRQALAATGESLDSCLEPVSETCLTYAYALYDLGRALRLDRQPTEAVPVLEHRLQIANQRPTVQSQLELARQEAGRQTPIAPPTG